MEEVINEGMDEEINEQLDPIKKKRAFTGIWIRKEIYLTKELNLWEKVLYVEIESLTEKKGCFASNKYFAKFLGVGESTVSRAVSKLISLGLIELKSFDGRKRTLRIVSDAFEKLKGSLIESIKQPNRIYEDINMRILNRDYSSEIRISEEVKTASENPSPSDKPLQSKPTLLKRKQSQRIKSKLRNRQSLIPKKKEVKPITVPKSIQDIIDYWNSSGLRQHTNPTTKIYKEIVKRTKQILRNKFEVDGYRDKEITPEKIKLSIAHLKIAATNPSYEPVSSGSKDYLRGISLSDFFYNSHAIRNKSLMLYYLEPPLPLKDPLVANDHPYVTEEFKEQYVKYVLGGVHSEEFSNREENCFRKASKLMLEFFDKNGDRIDLTPLEQKYPNNLVRYVFAALDKQINEDWTKVTPGWFSQPSLYSKTLPAYLYNQAIIEEPIND